MSVALREDGRSQDIFGVLLAAAENREPVALVTVIEVQGASPARGGFKLLVRRDGSCAGNPGGGALEERVFGRILFPTGFSAYANAVFASLPDLKSVGLQQVVLLHAIRGIEARLSDAIN